MEEMHQVASKDFVCICVIVIEVILQGKIWLIFQFKALIFSFYIILSVLSIVSSTLFQVIKYCIDRYEAKRPN